MLQILLAVSLSTNLILGILYCQSTKRTQQLVSELCGEITLSGLEASSRLDEALETNNRHLALIAGIKLEQLSGLLKSNVSLELGVQNIYGPGSLSSLAELIIWGDSTLDLSPIGRINDQTPFSTSEIAIMEKISSALKELSLSFYPKTVTENTYMNEVRLHSTITAINTALKALESTTSDIFNTH